MSFLPECSFDLIKYESDGLSLNCQFMKGHHSRGFSLNDCMLLTRRVGGNAFNFNVGHCEAKFCRNDTLTYSTNHHGGWDVYIDVCVMTCEFIMHTYLNTIIRRGKRHTPMKVLQFGLLKFYSVYLDAISRRGWFVGNWKY